MPDTPAGRQLAWIFDVVNSRGPLPKASDVEERFSPEFLDVVPAMDLVGMFQQIRSDFAPLAIIEIQAAQSEYQLGVIARSEAGMDIEVLISVQRDEPYLIEGLWFAPHAGATTLENWEALDSVLAAESGAYGVHAAHLNAERLEPLHQVNQDEPLAIGSAFKLYVLGALVEEIEAGNIAWSDQIELVSDQLSLPSGITQDEEIGTLITVEELAFRMISISDNTATDLLISALGRAKVEAALITLGNSVPEMNRPFLTTREMFIIKLGNEAGRSAFAKADEVERRTILAGLADAPLPDVSAARDWTSPRNIDTIEWFATMEDLSRALQWHYHAWNRPGLEPLVRVLTSNPGVTIDAETFPVVAFKGGSELGVLTLAWLLRRHDGEVFTLAITMNDAANGIDETSVAFAAAGAIGLFA
jgi:hypothetical protein